MKRTTVAYAEGGQGMRHSMLADGRFRAAVATSTDPRTWTRRPDFGAGTGQPSLAPNGRGGYVLAYERDPDNHIAVRDHPDLDALLAGEAARAYDAPRTLSRCAEGTPDVTAVHGDTVELPGTTGSRAAPTVNSGRDSGTSRRGTSRPMTGWTGRWRPGGRRETSATAPVSNRAANLWR